MRRADILCLLFLAGCAALTPEAERRRVYQIQELKGQVSDLRARLASATEEKRRLQESLDRVRQEAAAAVKERDEERAKSAELSARLRTSQDAGSGLGADLDLCQRIRKSAEENLQTMRAELGSSQTLLQTERARWREELEACRGSVSDLEAETAFLTAARAREEREKREKVQEIGRTYESLLGDARSEADRCRGQLSEAREEVTRVAAERDTADAPRRRRCEQQDRLTAAWANGRLAEIGSNAQRFPDRVRLIVPDEKLFTPGTTRLSSAGKVLLAPMAEYLAMEWGGWLAVYDPEDDASLSGDSDRLGESSGKLPLSRAATVARELLTGGGGSPRSGRLSVAILEPVDADRTNAPPGPASGIEIHFLSAPAVVCETPPTDPPIPADDRKASTGPTDRPNLAHP